MKTVFLATLMLSTSLTAVAETTKNASGSYSVDPSHGYILFSYNHMGLSNPSVGFNSFSTTLDFDATDPTQSAISVTIDADSIDSRVPVFNEHLVGEKFFNTEEFPEITFVATSIDPQADGSYSITGDLTMKGITKPIVLDATIVAKEHPMKNIPAVGVSATGTLLRSDWDLGLYAPTVSDDVVLTIEVEMLKD